MKLQNIFSLFISCSLMLAACTSLHVVEEKTAKQNIVTLASVPTPAGVGTEENSTKNAILPSPETTGNNFFPTFKEETFSFENTDTKRPENILQDISFLPIGGGLGPHFCGKLSVPEICDAPDIVDWPEQFCILTQGWSNKEKVTIKINFPNGEKTEEVGEANSLQGNESGVSPGLSYCLMAPFSEMQVGEHKFIFEGKSGRVEKDILVQIPKEPRADMEEIGIGRIGLILTGFQPLEPVQLLAYKFDSNAPGKASFVSRGEYIIDNNGRLLIEVPPFTDNHYYAYLAVGEISGLAIGNSNNLENNVITCGFPSHLFPGDHAQVIFIQENGMQIRTKPGLFQQALEKISGGTEIEILDGPHCADDIAWWLIRTNDDVEGWVSEYQNGVYMLEPIP